MKIMLVGGAGYIGSVLTPALLDRGHKIIVADLMWFGDHLPNDPRLNKLTMDAWNITEENKLSEIDCLVFLAGLSNDPMADFNPQENFRANAALPAYLAYIAGKSGVRKFIHAGSCSVYGDARLITESGRPQACLPYGAAKLMGELGVEQQAATGMEIVNFRMGTICGWSPRMRFDLVINTMVKTALTEGVIRVTDETAQRPILDIRDAVECYIKAIEDHGVRGTVNLASQNITIGDLARAVQAATQEFTAKQIPIEVLGKTDVRSYSVDKQQAKRLGFVAERPVSRTIWHVLEHWDGTVEHEAAVYYNIKRFKELD